MYIQQAYKGKTEWWRYLSTFLILVIVQIIGSIPLSILFIKNAFTSTDTKAFKETFNPELLGISQNVGLIILMVPMVLSFFALILSIRYIHGLSFTQIFTSARKFRWKNFTFAFVVWGVLLIVAEIFSYQIEPENYVFEFNPSSFFPLLIIALIMIPLQAGAEELYFRGNLMQGLGLLSRSRVIALMVTSIIFGLMHISNPEVKQFGIAVSMTYYIGFGLLMGLLVLLDGGLEMPLAIHAINNIYGAVFVGYTGSVLQTPALFKVTKYSASNMLIMFSIAAAIFLLIGARRFIWQNLSDIVKPVEK
jgi:membrane protease YdiL (CAAX protease family)